VTGRKYRSFDEAALWIVQDRHASGKVASSGTVQLLAQGQYAGELESTIPAWHQLSTTLASIDARAW